ncbi:ArsR/SmtB family transcription factor [Flavobacterium croceum]|uniref:DNA-binding transcriptional ArsR family regulator n=1 Tax=Flavobacterium croceum DSM 17960 TaxID=1121886 RepID=A0A2S4N7C5_9FLAO|nr:metalloregulator ArsR/SmtB family transcription factor [Flavobacterium croceum]POS01622.1 DNA-binding transcriptional ArsR family regulator [Flavobacterium croceum DSM 17960]
MGTSKKKSFDSNVNQIADTFKSIAHPARLQVLHILLEKKSASCGEIVSLLPLSQSTVSKHLIELKKTELIGEIFDGKKTIFFLKKDSLTHTSLFLNDFLKKAQESNSFEPIQKKSLKKKSIGIINDIFVQAVKPKNRIANPALKSYNHKFSFSNKLKN